MGMIAEGVFNATRDTIELIGAPTTTIDMLLRMNSIMQRMRDGGISKAEVEKEAATLPPAFASAVRHANENAGAYALLAFIVMLAITLWQMHGSAEFEERLFRVLENPPGYEQNQTSGSSAQPEPQEPRIIAPTAPEAPRHRARKNAARRARLKAHRTAFGGAALRHKH